MKEKVNGKVSVHNGSLRKHCKNFKKAGLSYSTFDRAFVFKNLTGLSYRSYRAFVLKFDRAFVSKICKTYVSVLQGFRIET